MRQYARVVAATVHAHVADKVKLLSRALVAVVAEDRHFGALKLCRHWLRCDDLRKVLPERRHVVKERARAGRADKVGALIGDEAGAVNGVTAIHKDDTLDACVQMLGANRARGVEIVLDADVIAHLDRHADAAAIAVEKINIEALADATHAALAAVVDVFGGRAVVKLADGAGVGGEHSAAVAIATGSGPGLNSVTVHAIHEFGGVAVDRMGLVGVVTEAADEPATTALGLVLAATLIVFATHDIIRLEAGLQFVGRHELFQFGGGLRRCC